MSDFIIKDSGERKEFSSGSLRDVETDKIDWSKTFAGPMLRRWAIHLTNGAKKYPDVKPGVGNWTLIETDEEYERYRRAAYRHFMQWYGGETDEDHASAVFFGINGVELIKVKRLQKQVSELNSQIQETIDRLSEPVLLVAPTQAKIEAWHREQLETL